jgi:hypothetical protein
LGNIVVETKYLKAELMADQMGKTVLDRRVSGVQITVTTELAEVLNMETVKVVFPHATLVGTTPDFALDFESMIGDSDLANAGELNLHPLSKVTADETADYTFYKACASAESSITYGPDSQARLKIVWNILPDTSVSPAKFYRYGDPAVV